VDGDGGGDLADTGARVGSLGLLALALLVLGGAAVLSSRARRQH
jgi:LPXTG-motif cell wall-anchored protein